MPETQIERFIITSRFLDFVALEQTLRGWDLDIRHLDGDRFEADVLQVGIGDVMVASADFKGSSRQRGHPPEGLRTFAILAESPSCLIWRRKAITMNTVMAFPQGEEFDVVSQSGGVSVFTLSIAEERLAEAGRPDLPDLEELIGEEDLVVAEPSEMEELRRSLHRISRELTKRPSLLENPLLQGDIQFELPCKLLKVLSSSRPSMPRLSSRMRDRALKRIEEYIEAFPNEPHSVSALCRVAQVSERTLQYAFLERYGLTPKAYVRASRLNGAWRELRRSDPSSTTVTDVAFHWGFFHLGQFAADYRRHFGELPSETLRR